jgi:hypothetical protein
MGRRTNLALLALLAAAFLTGWLAFAYATAPARWALAVHAASGLAILLLVPWKAAIAQRGVRRRRPGRAASLLLAALVLVSLLAGLAHSTGALRWVGEVTAMEVHVGAALAAAPLALWHVLARPVRARRTDLSRRRFLPAGLLLPGGAGASAASEGVARLAGLPGAGRRFTGSYEVASFQPRLMPVTQWMFDSVPEVDAGRWRLRVSAGGALREWSYEELAAFRDPLRATLDCTGGFFSEQDYEGVRLSRLLPAWRPGQSLRVRSRTGYDRRFPAEEAPGLLLATRAGGLALDPGHGFPVRVVAPTRRGFWWVKWVDSIELEDLPWWWQLPFPLQ